MPIYMPKEKVQSIFAEHGGSEMNTGSTEGQIALFTFRITELSKHLQKNKKDFSCQRRLLALVGKRKALLNYLMKSDISKYRALVVKLGLRK